MRRLFPPSEQLLLMGNVEKEVQLEGGLLEPRNQAVRRLSDGF